MRGVFRLNVLLAAAPLSVWKVVRRATSHRVTRFPGVAVVAHDVPCFQISGRKRPMLRHAECDAPPSVTVAKRVSHRAFTLVTVRLVTWMPRDFGPRI
jgi:hypothetical protein